MARSYVSKAYICARCSQMPMVYITELIKRRYNSSALGNLVFWLSFCVFGQPWAVMMYWTMYTESRSAQHGLIGAA